jgi:hypothetical protein
MRHSTRTTVSISGIALAIALSGCASSRFYDEEPEPDQIVSRIDDLSVRPDWLKESEPFVLDADRVVSLGGAEIPADHRIDAAYRIAENNAQASIAGAIEKKLEFIFQNAEEGTGFDQSQARFIGAEATRMMTSSMRPGKHYWEKVASVTDSGRRLTRYRVFATMEMPQEDFKRAVLDAARRAAGKGGLSADFADKVNRQWDRFTAPQDAPAAAPAVEPVAELVGGESMSSVVRALAVSLLFVPLFQAGARVGAPAWALKDTQRLDGKSFRVVCSGTGPSIGFARQDALDSCKVSAAQQLTTEITVKSMSVTSESQAAYQQEVLNLSQVSGLSCTPRREEIEEGDAEVRLWLLCEFDLAKAHVVRSRGGDRRPDSDFLSAEWGGGRARSSEPGALLSDERKVLTLVVVPRCGNIIVRGRGPARSAPCAQNPVSVILEPGDRELILRADGYLPKTIFLGPDRAARGYAQVLLAPNP